MLRFICQNGNATFYQWRTGTVPKQVRKASEIDDTGATSKDIDEVWVLLNRKTSESDLCTSVASWP